MRKRMIVALVVLACAGASALCAVGAAFGESASQEGSVKLWAGGVVPRAAELERPAGIEFHVIKKNEPEVDGYNWLHGVALCWHKGRLYAYYGTNRGKENTANEEAHVRVSDDGGKTWGKVQVVAKGGNGLGISHGALASHNGELWCFAGAFSNKCSFVHTLAFTLDEAQGTWVPRGVVAGHGFWPMQGPSRMPDGNWIIGGLRVANGWNLPGGARPAAAISHGDDFTKWDVSVVEKGDVANIWGESTVDVLGSCVTLTMRPGWKANPSVAYVATSSDCGRSWTPLKPSNLPLATSKPFTGILSTGQRYVISQTTSDGGARRSPLTIAVGRPGEWAYSRVFLIRHAVFPEGPGASHPKAALAYPYAVEHEGKLYVGYSNSNGNDWNRNSAELAIMPVASLAVAPAGDVIRIEAEYFAEKGGWKVDTQFTHKMGSAYLIAASAGKPVADAVTTVDIPKAGIWRCWVRTKDWIPEHHPGKFAVRLGGKESGLLGASGKAGWMWENAGDFALEAGKCELRLVDKSGWFARCDAICLASPGARPPDNDAVLSPQAIADGGEYDVVVVGAGTAGVCAAVAAARNGAKTALVHDRPVLGGNASSEIKVQIEGASVEHPNARETGIIEEAQLLRLALGKNATISDALRVLAENERQLTVFDSRRVMRVETDGRRMSAVLARGTLDGKWTRYRGKMFIDCTGDGWLGYYAGLPYMTGREARGEFAEAEAPDAADAATMSGCISDGKFRFNSVVRDAPVAFETPVWARVLPQGFTRKLKPVLHQYGGFSPMWWMEHPGDVDDFKDPEFARDELIRYYVAFWGWGKNEWEHRELLANEELLTIPFIDGRRETLRLVGDYVMTGNDEKSARMFPDRISYGGWPMDTHDPLGMKAVESNGYWKHHPPLPIYSIPYRVLYSPALDNFFFAGRCQSATHMALGSIRVMSTLATLGQVCGTAAAECVRRGETPKDFGERHIAEFQQRLIKDDLYIPAIENEDARDVARTAKATASSSGDRMYFRTSDSLEWFTKTHHIAHPSKRVGHDGWLYVEGATPQSVVDGTTRPVLDVAHGWASDASKPLPQWIRLDFAKPAMIGQVRITFNSDLQQRKPDAPMPRTLAKAYRVEVLTGGEWRKVAEVKDNWRRLAVHDFPRCEAAAVRVTVTETWGDPRAQIFEIRAYDAGRGVAIDSGLPAGNIVFDGQDGDTVRIHQDLRDTFCEWFYWAFRVRGAAGRTLTFEFTDKSFDGGPVGVRGPVVSKDGGKTFSYPLDGKCEHGAFTYAFGADEDDVWFYECHPYLRENWDAFAAAHSSEAGKSFVAGTLCRSPKGADVPKARFGCIGREPRHRVFMCARHHCSETMASWVLEGAAEAFMADDDLGRWLRENVELMMVPFVDYDGCMAGDQGKCRRPHDHNRDYQAFIYPETKAIVDWIGNHTGGGLDMFLDVHCPGIRGREHECVHTAFMDPSIRPGSEATEARFSNLLEKLQNGSMRYRAADDIPFGTSWNNANTYKLGWGAALWACHKVKGAGVARSIEVPFANANGAVVTPETCRELGRDLAKTIKAYLEEQE